MSKIDQAMSLLRSTFLQYAAKEGDKCTLSKGELKDLLTKEMGSIFGKTMDQAALDKLFKDLDSNSDGAVDFKEFVKMVTTITVLCNADFQKKK